MEMELTPRLCDANGGKGRRVLNLRLREGTDGGRELVPVPPAAMFGQLAGRRPVCRVGGRLVVCSGTSAATVDDSNPSAALSTGCALPGRPLCAMQHGEDSALVMTDKGAVRISCGSGGLTATAARRSYPGVTLRAVQVSVSTQTIGARSLSKVYGENHRLTGADRDALAGELAEAYLDGVSAAASSGCFVQPVLARYRLKDRRGAVLFESPSVLLSLPGVSQCAESVELATEGAMTVATELQLKMWRIEAVIPDEVCADVAALEVYVSPQFHPYSRGERGRAVIVRDSSGYRIRVSLPGVTRALGSGRQAMLMSAVARMDGLERPAGRIDTPFTGTDRTVQLVSAPEGDAAADSAAIDKALRTTVCRASFAEALLSAPHSFTAACTATDGPVTAWGGLKAIRSDSFSPAIFAADTVDGAWQGRVVIRFDGNRGVESVFAGNGGCPVSLGPVLSYPSPDARSMTVLISSGGIHRRFDCVLTPDESGRRAVYIAPDMKPVALPESGGLAVVDISDAGEAFDDTVAFAPTDSPLNISSVTTLNAGAVRALSAVGGAEQAWDRGRSRFFAACSDGIITLALNAGGRCTARTADSRGATGDSCMAAGADAVYVLLRDAGGTVVAALDSRGAVRNVSRPGAYTALAYDRSHNELTAFGSGGGADVYAAGGCYERSCGECIATVCVAGEWYAVFADGLCRLSLPQTDGAVEIDYTDVYSPSGRRALMPVWLNADIKSDAFTGALTVSTADIAGNAQRLLAERRMSGSLLGPTGIRLASGPARSLAVSLRGRADTSTIIRSFGIRASWIRK